jgi:hypothetical protein
MAFRVALGHHTAAQSGSARFMEESMKVKSSVAGRLVGLGSVLVLALVTCSCTSTPKPSSGATAGKTSAEEPELKGLAKWNNFIANPDFDKAFR